MSECPLKEVVEREFDKYIQETKIPTATKLYQIKESPLYECYFCDEDKETCYLRKDNKWQEYVRQLYRTCQEE